MKMRSLAGLALAMALGGCSTYGYVDQGGGYYTGETVTRGSATVIYGSGVYPYYDYSPGMSYGLRYYSPYRSPYAGPYRHGYYVRPPAQRPPVYRPPHVQPPRPRPGHEGPPRPRPGNDRPPPRPRPPADNHRPERPRLDGAPWRNIDRARPGDGNRPPARQGPPRSGQPRSGMQGPPRSGQPRSGMQGPPRSSQPRSGVQGPRPGGQGAATLRPAPPPQPATGGQRVRAERASQLPARTVRPRTDATPSPAARPPARGARPAAARNVKRSTVRP